MTQKVKYSNYSIIVTAAILILFVVGIIALKDNKEAQMLYGSRGHCFLIKLKNSKQYVIGCEDPAALVDYYKKLHP